MNEGAEEKNPKNVTLRQFANPAMHVCVCVCVPLPLIFPLRFSSPFITVLFTERATNQSEVSRPS